MLPAELILKKETIHTQLIITALPDQLILSLPMEYVIKKYLSNIILLILFWGFLRYDINEFWVCPQILLFNILFAFIFLVYAVSLPSA